MDKMATESQEKALQKTPLLEFEFQDSPGDTVTDELATSRRRRGKKPHHDCDYFLNVYVRRPAIAFAYISLVIISCSVSFIWGTWYQSHGGAVRNVSLDCE